MSTALGVIGTGCPLPARPALLVGESPLPVGTAARLGETARRLAPQAEVELARDPGILGGGHAVTDTRRRPQRHGVGAGRRDDGAALRESRKPHVCWRPSRSRAQGQVAPSPRDRCAGWSRHSDVVRTWSGGPSPAQVHHEGVERASGTTIGTGFRWVGSPRPRGLEHRERRFPPDRPTAGPGATATTPPGPSVGAALLMAAGRLTC